jgi:beta-xylosidase
MQAKILSLLLLFISASCFSIHNPVIWADVPDIDMIRVQDTYYMVSTTMFFSPGVPIMKSKDLASWETNFKTTSMIIHMDNGLHLLDIKMEHFMYSLQAMERINLIFLKQKI